MSSRSRRQAAVALVGMAGASILGALALPKRRNEGDRRVDLEAMIPVQFGPWQMDRLAAVFVRPADDLTRSLYQQLVERTYMDGYGRRVMLSVAFGAEQSAGLELHVPEICYRYGGITVRGRHLAQMDVLGEAIHVTRLAADMPQRPEAVTYWIVLGGERIADANTFRLRRLANAVRRRPADGLLVRVSSLDFNTSRAHALQVNFIADMVQALSATARELLIGRRVAGAPGSPLE